MRERNETIAVSTSDREERNNKVNNHMIDETASAEKINISLVDDDPNGYILVNVYKDLSMKRLQNVNVYAGQTRTTFFRSADTTANTETKGLFVKCILMMTFTMFLLSGVLVLYVMITPGMMYLLSENVVSVILLSICAFFIVDYVFVCVKCARVGPCNFVCLCITVLSLSTVAATISARTDSELILLAIFITSATVFVAIALAYTKLDFKSYKLYGVMLGTAFAFIALLVLFLVTVKAKFFDTMWLLTLVIVTVVQVVLIVMQLQNMLWNRTIALRDDDYSLGAFMLYSSVFDIFIKMLQIADVTRDIDEQ